MSAVLISQQARATQFDLLRAGGSLGFLIVAAGIVLTVWGVWNLLKVRDRKLLALQAFCSLIPVMVAATVALEQYRAFLVIAMSSTPPRPAEMGVLISKGLLIGTVGPLASVIPAALGIAALTRTADDSDADAVYERA